MGKKTLIIIAVVAGILILLGAMVFVLRQRAGGDVPLDVPVVEEGGTGQGSLTTGGTVTGGTTGETGATTGGTTGGTATGETGTAGGAGAATGGAAGDAGSAGTGGTVTGGAAGDAGTGGTAAGGGTTSGGKAEETGTAERPKSWWQKAVDWVTGGSNDQVQPTGEETGGTTGETTTGGTTGGTTTGGTTGGTTTTGTGTGFRGAPADPSGSVEVFGNVNIVPYVPSAPPNVADDEDRDGISNAEERRIGTDPQNPDTDGDLLYDGEEVRVSKTDPNNPDSDGDGVADGTQFRSGL